MKKFLALFFVLLSCSLCFADVNIGIRGFLVPNFTTGGNVVAENDFYSLLYTYSVLNPEYEDSLTAKRSLLGFSGEAFLNFGIAPRISLEGCVGITTGQGYTTDIKIDTEEGPETVLSYKRDFKTIDFSILAKYFFTKSSLGQLSVCAGPQVSYAGNSISEGIYVDSDTSTVQEYEGLQNPLLFGLKAGAEVAVYIENRILVSFNALGFIDFNPIFNQDLTGEWFSKAVGNRFGFYLGIGVAYNLIK